MYIMLLITLFFVVFCFFKQKTAYEMRISDWSSDVCSSDLPAWTQAFRARRSRCHMGVTGVHSSRHGEAIVLTRPSAIGAPPHPGCPVRGSTEKHRGTACHILPTKPARLIAANTAAFRVLTASRRSSPKNRRAAPSCGTACSACQIGRAHV